MVDQNVGKAMFVLYIYVNQKMIIMTIKLSLLKERAEYFVTEFGDKVKVCEPDEQGFVVLEFEVNDEWEVLKVFHAGFHAGFNYHKKHTIHLV